MAIKGMSMFTHNGEDYTVNDPNNAGEFSTSNAYAIGDYVYYAGNMYRFVSAHAAGAWNGSHVVQVTVGGELKSLKGEISNSQVSSKPEFQQKMLVMGEVHNYRFMIVRTDHIEEVQNNDLAYNKIEVTPGEVYYVLQYLWHSNTKGVIFTDASGNVIAWYQSGDEGSSFITSVKAEGVYTVPEGAVYMYVNYAHLGLESNHNGFIKPFYIYKYVKETGCDIANYDGMGFEVQKYWSYSDGIVSNTTFTYVKIPVQANEVYRITGRFTGSLISDAMFVNNNNQIVYQGRYTFLNSIGDEDYEVAVPTNAGIKYMVLSYVRTMPYSITRITEGTGNRIDNGKKLAILGDSRSSLISFPHSWSVHMKALCGFRELYVDGVSSSNMVSGSNSFLNRYTSIPSDSDIIAVYGGVNDFANNLPLGTITDSTSDTFYGGVSLLLNGIQRTYPKATLFVITPEYCTNITVNSLGLKLEDYVTALINICKKNKIKYINHFEECGINTVLQSHITNLFPDGIHANAMGNMLYAREFAGYINSIFA